MTMNFIVPILMRRVKIILEELENIPMEHRSGTTCTIRLQAEKLLEDLKELKALQE